MTDIQPHQPDDGDAVPAATAGEGGDAILTAAHRLIDAIATGYNLPDVTHPRWCHPPNCTVRPGRAAGTHQSEHHIVTTSTAVVEVYVEAGKRTAPLLILERRSRCYEQEPYTIIAFPVAAARDLLAAFTTLVEDLGPVTL